MDAPNTTLSICPPGIISAMLHLELLRTDAPVTVYRWRNEGQTDQVALGTYIDHADPKCAEDDGPVMVLNLTASEYAKTGGDVCSVCLYDFSTVVPLRPEDELAVQELDVWADHLGHAPARDLGRPKWLDIDPTQLWRSGISGFRNLSLTPGIATARAREIIATNLREMDATPAFRLERRTRLLGLWCLNVEHQRISGFPHLQHPFPEFKDVLEENVDEIRRDLNAENEEQVLRWWDLVTADKVWTRPGFHREKLAEVAAIPDLAHPATNLLKVPTIAVKHLPENVDLNILILDVPAGTPDDVVYAAEQLHADADSADGGDLGDYIAALTAAAL